MKKVAPLYLFFVLLFGKTGFAQPPVVINEYIARYKEAAIEEMQRTGVPAAITLAQGIHETEAGRSNLVLMSNNHFGIKCKTGWVGESVSHDDDAPGECFRKYADPIDSYKDHSDFLRNGARYAFLFNLDPMDYEAWAKGLKKAGYATNPKYPQILVKLIQDYNLQDYTLIAMGRKKEESSEIWAVAATDTRSGAGGPSVALLPVVKNIVYPAGVFKINETDVVFIAKGTSFLAVADEYKVPLSRLFDFNDMPVQEAAAEDGLIYLQRKRKKGNAEFHTVRAGETLYAIAQAEAIRLENLLQLNYLKTGMQPQTGEVLYLQNEAPGMPKVRFAGEVDKALPAVVISQTEATGIPAIQPLNEDYIVHIVQPKETMYSISKKYEVTIDDVLKWNDMQSADLKMGQELRISKKMVNAN